MLLYDSFIQYIKNFNDDFRCSQEEQIFEKNKLKENIDYDVYLNLEKQYHDDIIKYLNPVIDKLTENDSSFDCFRKYEKNFFSGNGYLDEEDLADYVLGADENIFENEVEKTFFQIIKTYMENEENKFLYLEDYPYVVFSELIYLAFKNNYIREDMDFSTFALESKLFETPLQLRQKIGCPSWQTVVDEEISLKEYIYKLMNKEEKLVNMIVISNNLSYTLDFDKEHPIDDILLNEETNTFSFFKETSHFSIKLTEDLLNTKMRKFLNTILFTGQRGYKVESEDLKITFTTQQFKWK